MRNFLVILVFSNGVTNEVLRVLASLSYFFSRCIHTVSGLFVVHVFKFLTFSILISLLYMYYFIFVFTQFDPNKSLIHKYYKIIWIFLLV